MNGKNEVIPSPVRPGVRSSRRVVAIWLCLLLCGAMRAAEEAAEPVTAILGAMQIEINSLVGALEDPQPHVIQKLKFTTGKLSGRRVVIAKMGIGKVNAAFMAALTLERFKPAQVLVTGIAGAVNADVAPGDIIVATQTAYHDFGNYTAKGIEPKGVRNPVNGQRNPIFFPADPHLLKLAEASAGRLKLQPVGTAANPRIPRVVTGTIVTGDVFVADDAKRASLRSGFNADAVEMEGAAVAQLCLQQGVPCLVIRCISDGADTGAIKDVDVFKQAAAANSAAFVRDIVSQLASDAAVKP